MHVTIRLLVNKHTWLKQDWPFVGSHHMYNRCNHRFDRLKLPKLRGALYPDFPLVCRGG
jgi:hypothetical protein